MIETIEKNEKIKISKNELIDGQPILDYLISSIKESQNNINNIHKNMSQKLTEIKNENLTNEDENKINDEFNKVFNINHEKSKNLFEVINDINKSHINKYKILLNILNLNLVFEKNEKEDFQETFLKELTLKKELKYNEINYNKNISDKNIENENIIKSENQEENKLLNDKILKDKENLVKDTDKNNLQNNINQNQLKIEGKIDLEKKEIQENDSFEIIDYKENANYYKNNNESMNFKNKKFFFEEDDNELGIKDEENDIIINENDDSISHLDNTE